MYRGPHWSVEQSRWQWSWLTSPVSPMAAGVTGACITHLSKRLSLTHPLSAESQHHGLTTLYLRAHRHPQKTRVHTSTCAHTQYTFTDTVPIMVTNPAWAGSHLWVTAWCVVRVKLPRHLPFADGSVGCPRALSGGHGCRIKSTYIFPKVSGWRGKLSHKGGQVNHHASLGLIR